MLYQQNGTQAYAGDIDAQTQTSVVYATSVKLYIILPLRLIRCSLVSNLYQK